MDNKKRNLSRLLHLDDYCVVTFPTTSQALKGEKAMKEREFMFVMMPTPREVSTSCGLAMKLIPGDVEECCETLKSFGVEIAGVFRITKQGSIKRVEVLDQAQK